MKAVRFLLCALSMWSAGWGQGGEEEPAPVPARETETGIYIPYEEFWRVFERENRGVYLPYGEYRKLVEQAKAAGKTDAGEGLKGTLVTELAGVLEAGDGVASGTATVTVEVFSKGWHEVPLRLDPLTLTRARLDGVPARIRREEASGYVLMLEKRDDQPSTHVLELEFAVPLEGDTKKSVAFPLPDVAVNRWTFSVPDAEVSFGEDTPLAVTRLENEDRTSVELLLAGHKFFRVHWTPEVEGARNMRAVVRANVRQEYDIQPDIIRSVAEVALRIDRAPLEGVTLRLPASERVVEITSPDLRSWTAGGEVDGVRAIEVVFQKPRKGDVTLRVESERYEVGEEWSAPLIGVEGATRQIGSLLLLLDESLRVEPSGTEGLSRLDLASAARIPGRGGHPSAGWSYRSLPAVLRLELEEVEPEIGLTTHTVMVVDPRGETQRVAARFQVDRAGVFQLGLSIPDGFEFINPEWRNGKEFSAVRYEMGSAENGRRRVDFDFERRVRGAVELKFDLKREVAREALQTPTGEEVEIAVPVVRGIEGDVVRDEGRVVVGAPAYLALRVRETGGVRERPWRAVGVEGTLLSGQSPQLGFRHTGGPVRILLTARRRDPYLTVDQLLVMRAESGVAHFTADFQFQVNYSGVRTLRVDVPTDLADDIRITREEIRKREVEDAPDVKEGMTAWLLEGPGEFLGGVSIPLAWEVPLSDMDVGTRRDLAIPHLIPRGVDRSQGQIVLRKAESMDVVVAEAGNALIPIDPRHDLRNGRSIPDAALAYEFQRDWSLTATLVKYEPVAVKATSIDRAWIRQVVTRGGEVSVQALYQLRSVRQRLEVRLPEGAVFDAQPLRVNGAPASLERGGEGEVFLPLTGTRGDEALLLELRYSLSGGGRQFWLPHFPEDPAVQKVYMSVYLPDDQVYLGHRGGWNPETIWYVKKGFRMVPRGTRSRESLWGWVREGLSVQDSPLDRLPTDGQYLLYSSLRPETEEAVLRIAAMPHRGFLVAIVGGGVLLGLGLLRCAVRVRLVVSAGLVGALALAGVFLPSFAHALVNEATAAGAFLVVLLWGVYDLLVRLPEVRKTLPKKPADDRGAPLRPGSVKPRGPVESPPAPKPEEPEDSGADSETDETKEADDA